MSQQQVPIGDKAPNTKYFSSEFNIQKGIIDANSLDAEARLVSLSNSLPLTITSLDDLAPFLIGGVYRLPVNRYTFKASINFGTTPILLVDTGAIYTFYGTSFEFLSYTGSGPFISTDTTGVSLNFIRMFLSTPNAIAISLTNGNSLIIEFPVFVACMQCVSLVDMAFFTSTILVMVDCTTGCVANNVGTTSAQLVQWSGSVDAGGTAMTFLGASSERLFMDLCDTRLTNSESFLDIQATYGGDVDIVGGIHTNGAAGPFFKAGSRMQDDVDILIQGVKNVTSSTSFVDAHFTGNALVTTISSAGVAVKVNTTWGDTAKERFTFSAGTWTYIGKEDITRIPVAAILTVEPAGGGTKDVSVYIALNGVIEAGTKGTSATSAGGQVSSVGKISLVTGDTFEVWVANDTDTSNLTCTVGNFEVN